MVVRKTAELLAKQGWVRKPRLEKISKTYEYGGGTVTLEECYVHSKYPILLSIVSHDYEGRGTVDIEALYIAPVGTGEIYLLGWDPVFWISGELSKKEAVLKAKEFLADFDVAAAYRALLG